MVRGFRRSLRGCALGAAVVTSVLGFAHAADARVNVTDMIATTVRPDAPCALNNRPVSWTQSGANADVCLALAFKSATAGEFGNSLGLGDDVRNLRVSLPPGQVGSPRAVPMCDTATFRRKGCPSTHQVGTVRAAAETAVGVIGENVLQGDIYLISPTGTEAARLGVQLEAAGIPAIRLEAEMRLRPEDNGVDTIVKDSPRGFAGIPIELRRMAMRLWGSDTNHAHFTRPFLSSPTDCSRPATYRVELTSYAGDTTVAERSPYTPTDCGTLKMPIGAKVTTDNRADVPTEVVADVTEDDDATAGRGNAHVRSARLVLPAGFEISASSGSKGLEGCTDEQFGLGLGKAATCPEASRIGTVQFRSPLLLVDELEGPVYIATPKPGSPKLRFFATAQAGPQDDAMRVKIAARAEIDPVTGQLTTVLEDLPPTPFTRFRFIFRGGPQAMLSTPRKCGTYTASIVAEGFPGAPGASAQSDTTIDQGCNDPEPFTPELTTELATNQAGADTSSVATLGRPDGSARLAGATVTLPPGLAGRLDSVPPRPDDVARAGGCGPESRVGSVTSVAGPGPEPLSLPGGVYLTTPIDGAPAGMAVIADAKVGPLDFGRIVVLAKVDVGTDASIAMTFLDVPQRMQGIPLNLRGLRLALDRPGFIFNASNCAPLQLSATLTSDTGLSSNLTAPYQVTGCDKLAFGPKLTAAIEGNRAALSPGGNPKLRVQLASDAGSANVRAAAITMPAGISVDITKLSTVCPLADYEKGTCAPASQIGTVSARTPLLNDPLTGVVRFVSVPGVPLPQLGIQIRGRISLDLTGKVAVDAQSRLVTTLDPVPDTPISSLVMTLGGVGTPLVVGKDLCASASNPVLAKFTSWAGSTVSSTTQLQSSGCTPSATLKVTSLRRGRPGLDLRVASGQAPVNRVELGLPSGLTYASARSVRARVRVSATNAGKKKATVTISGSKLRVTFPKGVKATTVRVRIAGGAVRVSPRLRRSSSPRLRFTVGTRTASGKTKSLRVAVRPG